VVAHVLGVPGLSKMNRPPLLHCQYLVNWLFGPEAAQVDILCVLAALGVLVVDLIAEGPPLLLSVAVLLPRC
jgi:hypothetical protein